MRKLITSFVVITILLSCNKVNTELSLNTIGSKVVPGCNEIESFHGRKPKPTHPPHPHGGGNGGGSSTPSYPETVVLLDFDGAVVENTSWNYFGTLIFPGAGVSNTQYYVDFCNSKYSRYNIRFTTSQYEFDTASRGVRCIVTTYWEWYAQAGGVAFIGSFPDKNTPCFVFSSLLLYNPKHIAEAICHEVGHTLGLRHQCKCLNGVIIEQYSTGYDGGITAPVMGYSYYVQTSIWTIGPTPSGCSYIQNDDAIITSVCGLR